VVHEGQEQPRRALRAAELAAAAAEAIGDQRELARAYGVIDSAHSALGDLHLAVHLPQVVAIYESIGQPHRAAVALVNQGALHYYAGRWADALDCYRRSYDVMVRTGDVVNAALAQENIAELLVNRGQYAEAREITVEAGRTHRAVGFVGGALFAEILLGRLVLGEGDADEAAGILRSVVDEASTLGLHGTALEAAIHLAACHVATGDHALALEVISGAEAAAGDEAAVYASWAELVRSRALAGMGDADGARERRAIGIAEARRSELQYELGLLLVMEDDEAAREEGRALLTALDVGLVAV
jgi:tetratricopeptide (TPR) repeat protein